MIQRINFPSREQSPILHRQIIDEFNELLELNMGKNKQKILNDLALKYGYSSGQAVRNMIHNKKRKESGG
ncbi:hypothetical protein CMT52_17885 [Elizabethkingia anophelis]|nr:hypothetical protein [Elizabethkingia anophelis]